MSSLKEKKEILEKANYRYHFNRSIYFNKNDKIIFSLEAIEDSDTSWLSDTIRNNKSNKWSFFFNEPPSERIKDEIVKELGE